jgi:hypothetical protein
MALMVMTVSGFAAVIISSELCAFTNVLKRLMADSKRSHPRHVGAERGPANEPGAQVTSPGWRLNRISERFAEELEYLSA